MVKRYGGILLIATVMSFWLAPAVQVPIPASVRSLVDSLNPATEWAIEVESRLLAGLALDLWTGRNCMLESQPGHCSLAYKATLARSNDTRFWIAYTATSGHSCANLVRGLSGLKGAHGDAMEMISRLRAYSRENAARALQKLTGVVDECQTGLKATIELKRTL